jgi:serine/threonine protein kinase
LGTGSYASVKYALERKTGIEYAIKIYEKYKLVESHRRKNLRREIAIMNKLHHSSLIKLFNAIETKR